MAWEYDDTRGQDRYAWSWNSAQAIQNAWEIYNYFFENDLMSLEALCGLIGNIAFESHLNPWQEQVDSTDNGFGLIQWTPPTALTDVLGNSPLGSAQCSLIYNEIMDNTEIWGGGARWIPTSDYSYTGAQFCALGDISEATKAYHYERLRGTWSQSRIDYANYYWEVFTGTPPVPPVPPTPLRSKMPLLMYTCKLARYRKGIL